MKNILLVSTFIIAILNNCLSDPLPSPKEYCGFSIGDDYHLVNYRQTQSSLKNYLKFPTESDTLTSAKQRKVGIK